MGKKKVRLTSKELVLRKYPVAYLAVVSNKYFYVKIRMSEKSRCKHCGAVAVRTLGSGFSEEWAWQNASNFIEWARSENKKK